MPNYTLEDVAQYTNQAGSIAREILDEVQAVRDGLNSKSKATLAINSLIQKNHFLVSKTANLYGLRNLASQAIDSL